MTPQMFLYHINVGWPLLEEGTRFEAPIARTWWASDSVAAQGASYLVLGGAAARVRGAGVRAHELTADSGGLVRARLVNDRLGLAFELEYDQRQFPSFFQWLHRREGAYAVGFEPSTHTVGGEQAARDDGTMTWLAAGESRTYSTTFRILDAAA